MENTNEHMQHANGQNQTRWDKTITCMKTPSFLLGLGLVNLIILLRLLGAVMHRDHMGMRGGDMRNPRMMKGMMMRGYPQGNMMYQRGQATTMVSPNGVMMQRAQAIPAMEANQDMNQPGQAMMAQPVQGQTVETTTVSTQ